MPNPCDCAVVIDGVRYVPETSKPTGKRAVVVVDRGWIFAGDVERANGRIAIRRAVWVFRWDGIGFDAVIENPKDPKAQIRKMPQDIDLPDGAEIFCVPVADDWGL